MKKLLVKLKAMLLVILLLGGVFGPLISKEAAASCTHVCSFCGVNHYCYESDARDCAHCKRCAAAKHWGPNVPDSSIQLGDTIDWNGKKFKAVLKGTGEHAGCMLMLSQSSFGRCYWDEVLDACSEHGAGSKTSGWYNGLNDAQKNAMKEMPKIKCDDDYDGVYSDRSEFITNTKLFPISHSEAKDISSEHLTIETLYWTRTTYGNYAWFASSAGDLHYNSFNCGYNICAVPAFYLNFCSHTNNTPSTKKEATCTSKGTTHYKCLDCGKEWDADIPALGHDFEPVCNGNGTDSEKCSRCPATQNTEPCKHYKTLTYNATMNGGTGDSSSDFLINSTVDLTKRVEKSGWEFVGWNINKDATDSLTSYSMPTENSTLYAIFKRSLEMICVDSNGDNPQNTTIYNRATSAIMPLPTIGDYFDETGVKWTPVGWTTSTNTVADYLEEGDSITVS